MPDSIIESILQEKLDVSVLIKWLNNEPLKDTPDDCILYCCSRSEFVDCFLSYLREQTDSVLQTNSTAVQLLSTPDKLLPSRRHHRSISDPPPAPQPPLTPATREPSPPRRRTGRRVKTKLFNDDRTNHSVSSDESRLSTDKRNEVASSTPMKNDSKNEFHLSMTSPVTPHSRSFKEYERCDTPRLSHRSSKSQEKSVSLGDYLASATKSKKKRNSKNVSNEESSKDELDLSNSDAFPEIGARKSTSLRSERRRIKPTNIDVSLSQKSTSLNSFNSECFQQPSPLAYEENSVFTQQKIQARTSQSFEAERSFLKQERHKLLEKFNNLNQSSPKPTTPQVKIMKRESVEKMQNFVEADITKVAFKSIIDKLIQIYDVLLSNNLIVSVNTELYFIISILLSKQIEEDYVKTESQLNDNNLEYLLRSIHNSTYFAVKSLWSLKSVLEVILDKNSLKVLGENKKVRGFYPDLAKFLLNSYGLKCEAESNGETTNIPAVESKPVVICFNFETDNIDNFPNMMSFHNFKRQRDMFYEIFRWYQECVSSGASRSTLKARVKALVSMGQAACNHAHLANLFVQHMMAECLQNTQAECKLSKLERRLTCPAGGGFESRRLPHFTPREMFYKDMLCVCESVWFRTHARDALCAAVVALNYEDTLTGCGSELRTSFLHVSRKLCLLAKFMGLLEALPYSEGPIDPRPTSSGPTDPRPSCPGPTDPSHVPKDKVLGNSIAVRNYSQPTIDLRTILLDANRECRLSVTIPWLAHYLSMLDYTTLRIKYYAQLIQTLYSIHDKLKSNEHLKKNTQIYLKSVLGWLYDLPHFPREFTHNPGNIDTSVVHNIDNADVIDETVLFELCPYLREVNTLLATCRVTSERESFRHITPVSLTLNSEDRMRNKEKELQTRLEEEYLKSLPSSTRRVVELVCERILSDVTRRSAALLPSARAEARGDAARLVREQCSIAALQAHYASQHRSFLSACLKVDASTRAQTALRALLSHAPAALLAAVRARTRNTLRAWLMHHYGNAATFCPDIEAEMRLLQSLPPSVPSVPPLNTPSSSSSRRALDVDGSDISVATQLIQLKELCNIILCNESPPLSPAVGITVRGTGTAMRNAPAPAARALARLSVDLCLAYISRRPKEVTEDLLSHFHAAWSACPPPRDVIPPTNPSPPPRDFTNEERAPTPDSDEDNTPITNIIIANTQQLKDLKLQAKSPSEKREIKSLVVNSPLVKSSIVNSPVTKSPGITSPTVKTFKTPIIKSLVGNCPIVKSPRTKSPISSPGVSPIQKSPNVSNTFNYQEENPCGDELSSYFQRILCPRNIVLLDSYEGDKTVAWEAMARVLVFLLENNYLSEDSLTEQCLAVYRQEWPQRTLSSVCACVRAVCDAHSHRHARLLRSLADYCAHTHTDTL